MIEQLIQHKDFIIEALSAYWNVAGDILNNQTLGDIERKNYEYQRDKSDELINTLTALSSNGERKSKEEALSVLWQEVLIFYGDIQKKESEEVFLKRMEECFSVSFADKDKIKKTAFITPSFIAKSNAECSSQFIAAPSEGKEEALNKARKILSDSLIGEGKDATVPAVTADIALLLLAQLITTPTPPLQGKELSEIENSEYIEVAKILYPINENENWSPSMHTIENGRDFVRSLAHFEKLDMYGAEYPGKKIIAVLNYLTSRGYNTGILHNK